ncbi:hypothetical protein [Candidatus Protochlamydia sp. W-9]|uniref:hypothetical protein n=1 Tax=Candidatus Protochlamydia sp. W-9 TaxID=1785087 RepID=UPI00130190BB|nr:hypothetical protein [Candidatus Protochlamydia sp. W-9]
MQHPGKRDRKESFLTEKVGSDIAAPFCYQGTCNMDLFKLWLEQFLVPELRPG